MPKKEFAQAISEILCKNKVITQQESDAMQKAFAQSAKPDFDDFLLEEGLVDEHDLLKALAEYFNVPAFDVTGYFFKNVLLRMFPKGFLLRNAIIPMEVDENIMVVVASDPNDSSLLSKLGEHVSYDIRFRVGLRRDICDAIKEFYEEALTEIEEDEDLREKRQQQKEEKYVGKEDDLVMYEEEDLG